MEFTGESVMILGTFRRGGALANRYSGSEEITFVFGEGLAGPMRKHRGPSGMGRWRRVVEVVTSQPATDSVDRPVILSFILMFFRL